MALTCEALSLYRSWVEEGVLTDIFHPRPTYLFARTDEEVAVIAHQGADLMALGERILSLTQAELMQCVPGLGRHVAFDQSIREESRIQLKCSR